MGGRFITLEGIDGAGKSSHLEAIATHLGRDGAEVVRTREPGGTALAEALRTLVLHAPMDPMTESLLVFAARRDHIASVIGPAIARGATVLCDRFTDATFAYQGAGRGFDTGLLETLERWVQQGLQPQLTLWFDLDPALARSRLVAARESDRFEAQGLDFFERVRDGYRSRSAADPGRFARIDAAAERAAVSRQVIEVLETRGW